MCLKVLSIPLYLLIHSPACIPSVLCMLSGVPGIRVPQPCTHLLFLLLWHTWLWKWQITFPKFPRQLGRLPPSRRPKGGREEKRPHFLTPPLPLKLLTLLPSASQVPVLLPFSCPPGWMAYPAGSCQQAGSPGLPTRILTSCAFMSSDRAIASLGCPQAPGHAPALQGNQIPITFFLSLFFFFLLAFSTL